MNKVSRRDMLRLIGFGAATAGLAACAPRAAAPAPEAKPAEGEAKPAESAPAKVVKITMVESWFGVPQYKESVDPVMKAITDKMAAENVGVQIESMILDDHQNKYTVLYASGADFTMAFDAPWYKMNSLRDQGAIIAIESLVDQYGSNLKKEITEKIYEKNFVNGHLYGIPAGYYYSGTTGVILREDLRKKWDAAAPTSDGGYASLQPYLEAVVKNAPELIPYALAPEYSLTTSNIWGRRSWGFSTKTGLLIADWSKGYEIVDMEDIPEYIDHAKLLRGWWEAGLVNKTDLPSSGPSQNVQVDYIFPGKAASCQENEPEYKWVDETKSLKSTVPDGELMGYDLTGMRAGKVKGTGALKQWNFIVFNASAPQEAQEAGIKYFDWLTTTQDNMDLWLMGVDGVNYKKADNLRFSEIEGVDAARNYRRMWYVSGLSGRFQRQPVDLPPSAEEALKFYSTEENWVFNPYEQFEPDTKAIEVELTKVQGVFLEAFHGLDTGQMATDEAKAKAKEMMDAAGRQDLKAKLQKQLDDYMKANPAK